MSSNDPLVQPDLSSLIGSRICHDLISPIGAIGNGLELLSMAGAGGPEVTLISDSVANANARIRFFRIAFGMASAEQGTARSEILSILKDIYGDTRTKLDWAVNVDCRRAEAKAAFLTLLCLENALPYGGTITVNRADGRWQFSANSPKLKYDEALWAVPTNGAPFELSPKNVQFALLPEALARLGRKLSLTRNEGTLVLSY
ncbi:histidine phosphotransferase family protein [Aliiruegeria sabulilitoris]|uniref:histidine phosphotransferase family protein n=1 Tax=Aliiruegeria sabulilitoris TaxID=1510458 RepID=UPI00082EB3A1|nr:histidine phosphotransferase family protein [Aliiruegeria sabulilitoris]NDR54845.1 histidine phosphotransferase [Pseudoruegeria sp. M32A2M]